MARRCRRPREPPGAELCSSTRPSSSSISRPRASGPAARASARSAPCGCASFELAEEFELLVDPGGAARPTISALTGLARLRAARPAASGIAVRRFLEFAGDAVLVAHNARFDLGFLDHETERLTGARLAGPVVDTVGPHAALLKAEPAARASPRSRTSSGPRPSPATAHCRTRRRRAEILVQLIGLAQERGARTVADLVDLAAPRVRKVYAKRSLAFGAPTSPGVYLFRDRHDQVLYVGRARDLRARLRSYFRTDRQRPAVEAALAALERIEWRVTGSELEAALEELRLLRELRPVANARNARPDRYVYLRRRGDSLVCSQTPTPLGPLRSRARARLACRALDGATAEELQHPELALPRLRARLRDLAECRRYEDAARLRDRIEALDSIVRAFRRIDQLRRARCCLLAPAAEAGFVRAVFVAGGRIAAVRTLPVGAGAELEVDAGLAETRLETPEHLAAEWLDELLLVGTFLRRPPPELRVAPLERDAILSLAAALPRALGGEPRGRPAARAA